jgi:hypothetical protein
VRKLNGRAVEPYRKQILGLPETIRRAHDEVRQLMRDGVGSIVVELGNDARAIAVRTRDWNSNPVSRQTPRLWTW